MQDKVLRASVVPERLRTQGLDLVYAELKGRWSKQTLTIDAYRDLKMYLKFEPRPDLDDKGIYFLSITLQQVSKLNDSEPDLVKFDFHLKGSTMDTVDRRPICAWIRRLWCRSSVSKRIDNDRTPEMAKLVLPFLEQ